MRYNPPQIYIYIAQSPFRVRVPAHLRLSPHPPSFHPRMQGSKILAKRFILILSLVLTVAAQHDHGHSHHGKAKSEWDEEEYLKWNPPTPPSYWSEDTRMRMNPDEESPQRYPWLMVLHVLFMSTAFFVALPAGEQLVIMLYPSRLPQSPASTGNPQRIAVSHTHIRSGSCPHSPPFDFPGT